MSALSVGNYAGVNGFSSYYTQRSSTRVGSDKVERTFSQSAGIHLYMNDPEGEDKALTSVGFPDGTSASVFSAEGYSSYTVRYWDGNGNAGEYDCDAGNVNPENANYLDMLAFCTHLDITRQAVGAFGDFINIAGGVNGDRKYDSGNLFNRYDFRQMTEEFMYAQYHLGNTTGYLSVKNLYEHMAPSVNEASESNAPEVAENTGKLEEIYERLTPLGIGFALAGNMGYGMAASLVTTNATDDTIVRVKVATGSGDQWVDVNLSEFNPRKATAVEMFAYCEYKDYIGEGVNNTWGSWNALKNVMSVEGMDFGSLDNIMNEKINWTGALAKSKVSLVKRSTGETLSAADLLKLFEEQTKLTSQELKDGDDWREMSDDDWDKLLSDVDNYIDSYKEDLEARAKKQMEAALKAAMEADPEMRSAAAQEAALSVAANGFFGGNDAEGDASAESGDLDVDHEKNWTRKLNTDDQVVLRTARAAQNMERMAMSRIAQIANTESVAYSSYIRHRQLRS